MLGFMVGCGRPAPIEAPEPEAGPEEVSFDILSYGPFTLPTSTTGCPPLGDIRPGGDEMIAKDLSYDGVLDGYAWCYKYKGKFYSAQYDGGVKLLHYRYDLANDYVI
jgi:hypothetical protein